MFGPIIRTTSSIDGTIELFRTEPGTWTSMTKTTTFKYNKNRYFWYLDGYLYFPNIDWDAVRMEAIFEGTVDTCTTDDCLIKQDQDMSIPEYLFAEVEQFAIKELSSMLQIPQDNSDDGQNALR